MRLSGHTMLGLLLLLLCMSCAGPDLHKPQPDWPHADNIEGSKASAKGPFVLNQPIRVQVSMKKNFITKSILFKRDDGMLKGTIAFFFRSAPGLYIRVKLTLLDPAGKIIRTADSVSPVTSLYRSVSMIGSATMSVDLGQWQEVKSAEQFSIELEVIKKMAPNHRVDQTDAGHACR